MKQNLKTPVRRFAPRPAKTPFVVSAAIALAGFSLDWQPLAAADENLSFSDVSVLQRETQDGFQDINQFDANVQNTTAKTFASLPIKLTFSDPAGNPLGSSSVDFNFRAGLAPGGGGHLNWTPTNASILRAPKGFRWTYEVVNTSLSGGQNAAAPASLAQVNPEKLARKLNSVALLHSEARQAKQAGNILEWANKSWQFFVQSDDIIRANPTIADTDFWVSRARVALENDLGWMGWEAGWKLIKLGAGDRSPSMITLMAQLEGREWMDERQPGEERVTQISYQARAKSAFKGDDTFWTWAGMMAVMDGSVLFRGRQEWVGASSQSGSFAGATLDNVSFPVANVYFNKVVFSEYRLAADSSVLMVTVQTAPNVGTGHRTVKHLYNSLPDEDQPDENSDCLYTRINLFSSMNGIPSMLHVLAQMVHNMEKGPTGGSPTTNKPAKGNLVLQPMSQIRDHAPATLAPPVLPGFLVEP